MLTKSFGAGTLADLHVYDPATRNWTDLSRSVSGPWPSARLEHGVVAAGSKIYVFGGTSGGNVCTC